MTNPLCWEPKDGRWIPPQKETRQWPVTLKKGQWYGERFNVITCYHHIILSVHWLLGGLSSAAYMRLWNRTTFVQMMDCRQFGAKPLSLGQCRFIIPPLQRSWQRGILVSPYPFVRLSVCGQNRVRSVSSTILIRSILYLHILSSNCRRYVACNARFKIQKFEIVANFLNL